MGSNHCNPNARKWNLSRKHMNIGIFFLISLKLSNYIYLDTYIWIHNNCDIIFFPKMDEQFMHVEPGVHIYIYTHTFVTQTKQRIETLLIIIFLYIYKYSYIITLMITTPNWDIKPTRNYNKITHEFQIMVKNSSVTIITIQYLWKCKFQNFHFRT